MDVTCTAIAIANALSTITAEIVIDTKLRPTNALEKVATNSVNYYTTIAKYNIVAPRLHYITTQYAGEIESLSIDLIPNATKAHISKPHHEAPPQPLDPTFNCIYKRSQNNQRD
jgi:hypothetical protein